MKKKLSIAFIFAFIFIKTPLFAQITVEDSITLAQVKETLQGEGVIISNLTITAPLDSGNLPAYGIFNDPYGALGMNKGIIMTNGAAVNAVGPNDQSASTQNNSDSSCTDPDLLSLIDTTWGNRLNDGCVIEFDITISSSVLIFNYIFASEEYPEFLGFNDVFGFFISGPGIVGTENLAVLPGSTTLVSVSSINHQNNAQYYVNNGNGSTPFDNVDIQYDGYTKTLQAKANVIPCETYHIKLAIADASDNSVDSGVFLEENSFSSGISPELSVAYEYPKFDRAIEDCNKAWVVVSRNRFNQDHSNQIIYHYNITGSAQNGLDYTTIIDSIVLEQGEIKDSILIEALEDNLNDDNEQAVLTFKSGCAQELFDDSIVVPVHEYYNHPMDSAFRCGNENLTLNKNPDGTDSLSWLDSPYLSCTLCQSPSVNNPVDTFYWFYATDKQSGCQSFDSVFVGSFDMKVNFYYHYEQCYTTVDVFFDNSTSQADTFFWDFGDGVTSVEKEPIHTYTAAINQTVPQSYEISLTGTNLEFGCKDTLRQTITIDSPFLLPNIITPNNDNQNDEFYINGINNGCWQLVIFNRWGKLVYQNPEYNNDFNANGLPDGTYYYKMINVNEDREFKGYFEVAR